MGDRGNIIVRHEDGDVCMYTHWGGSALASTVALGLSRAKEEGRLRDSPYLTRIMFCTLVEDDADGSTGFGLAPTPCDNEYPFLVVDCSDPENGMVVYWESDRRDGYAEAAYRQTSDEYPSIHVPVEEWLATEGAKAAAEIPNV